MKLTFDEKKLLYVYGNPDLALTRKRLYGVAGLTVDPDQNKLVLDFCRKLEDETLTDWYGQMFYFTGHRGGQGMEEGRFCQAR